MTEPSREAISRGRQIASAWRVDGRLAQLDLHIALALQELIEERDEKQQVIVDMCEKLRSYKLQLGELIKELRELVENADNGAWPETKLLNSIDLIIDNVTIRLEP